jgi:hypothetical protein
MSWFLIYTKRDYFIKSSHTHSKLSLNEKGEKNVSMNRCFRTHLMSVVKNEIKVAVKNEARQGRRRDKREEDENGSNARATRGM